MKASPLKLPNDVILITVHTGGEARRKLKDISTEGKNFFGEVMMFFERLGKLVETDEQLINQQEAGTKLL